jgi:hypothetical protein
MTKDEILLQAGMNLMTLNDDLMSERDEIRDWLIQLGGMVGVDPKSGGETVRENWALFRNDIFEKIKAT